MSFLIARGGGKIDKKILASRVCHHTHNIIIIREFLIVSFPYVHVEANMNMYAYPYSMVWDQANAFTVWPD